MPYIGNITSDFSIDTGNITNRAVTATKLSPSSVGSNGQVLSIDGSGNLQWGNDANAPEGTAVLSTGESGTTKYLRVDGDGTCSWQLAVDATKTTLTGSTDNTITTVTGANAIQGEANLTFDGSTLALAGNMQFTAANAQIEFNNGGPRFWSPAANTLTIHTGGGFDSTDYERLRVDSSGNVGIGTTSPTARLDVRRGDEDGKIAEFHTSTGFGFELGSSQTVAYIASGNAQIFHLKTHNGTNSLERLTIKSDGKVGIGTTSPEDLLHIKSGKIRIENEIVSNNDSTISYDNSDFLIDVDPNNVRGSSQFQVKIDTVAGLTIDDNRRVGIGTTSPDSLLHVESSGATSTRISGNRGDSNNLHIANIEFENTFDTQGVIAEIKAITGSSGTQSTKGQLTFSTDDGSTFAERLRIDSVGRILLGTQKSFGTQSYYDDITINNSDSDSGAAGGTGISLISGNNSWGAILFGDSDDDDVGYIKYAHSGDYMRFATGTGIRFRIDSDGVKFNGETAAVNGLNDYEEGTFTPTLRAYFNGAWRDSSYTTAPSETVGYFTRVGNLVYIFGRFVGFDLDSDSDGAYAGFGGLPFDSASGTGKYPIIQTFNANCFADAGIGFYIGASSKYAYSARYDSDDGHTTWSSSSGRGFWFWATYFAA
tara:strand:+ start:1109 stop:3067 length:1959 start_codon:yes stop_codon:yes gene_type:complete